MRQDKLVAAAQEVVHRIYDYCEKDLQLGPEVTAAACAMLLRILAADSETAKDMLDIICKNKDDAEDTGDDLNITPYRFQLFKGEHREN